MKHYTGKPAPSLLLLSIASGLSPFGMAIVVPAMNSIALEFDADFGAVQFVISAYLFGLAFAQPVCGYLCDRYGRRPVMLWGFSIFSVTSLFCAIAPTLELLVVARFFQALGVSVGTVASRAILRDCYDRNRMAEALSYIAAATGLAPILAPIFGGTLDTTVGYSSIFLATAVMGVIVFVSMFFSLVETLPATVDVPKIKDWARSYRILLSSRVFVGNTLVFGFVQGSFFSFLAIGSVLFATKFSISPAKFGLLWGVMAIAYVAGATIAAKLTPVTGTKRLLSFSIWASLIASVLAVAGASIGELSVAKILVPLGLLMLFAGAITPGSIAGAVADHPTVAGTASGLSSALGLLVGGSFSIASGVIYAGEYLAITLLMLFGCCANVACWTVANSRGRQARLDPAQ